MSDRPNDLFENDPMEDDWPEGGFRQFSDNPSESAGDDQNRDGFGAGSLDDIDAATGDAGTEIEGELISAERLPGQDDHRGGGDQDGRVEQTLDENAVSDESLISACQDPVLLTTLLPSALEVNPGTSVEMQVRLLNNGDREALFEVRFEGWIDPAWLYVNPIYKTLQPGERVELDVTISPLRHSSTQAGPRQIVVVVRSPDYPGRESRQVSILDVLPYDDVQLGAIAPRTTEISWGKRVGLFEVPVTNSGNHVVQARIQGQAEAGDFYFEPADTPQPNLGPFVPKDLLVTLDPGETALLRGSIRPRQLPFLGLQPKPSLFRILANVVGKPQVPRAAGGQMRRRPLIGPRRMVLLSLLFVFLLVALIILGMTSFGLVQIVSTLAPASDDLVVQPTAGAASPPVLAVVVPVDEPVPTSAEPSVGPIVVSVGDGGPAATQVVQGTSGSGAGRNSSVPLVGVGEVSSPGSVAVVSAPAVSPADISSPSVVSPAEPQQSPQRSPDRSTLTYAQMFQEIALRYDLDWRTLAAQAYVESRFDTLALGSDGDLGLMQVLPRTWKEWAPAVDVNDPFDAYSNVLVAGVYLDYLRSYLGPSGSSEIRWMLVAYNWGPDKLNTFLAEGNQWDDLPDGLKQYANDILRIAETIPAN